jgi:glycosyltransferase involved in cell wall biosynthesis
MNEKNLWLTQTLNRWIALSQWKYIARIDDDDIWCDKDKLKKQVEFMETNPEYWLCGTSVIQINEEWKEITKTDVPTDNDQIKKTLMRFNQFAHASVIFRRDIVSHVWVYNPDYNWAEDYEYWMRIWTMYKLANLPDYCLKYRHNTHGVSSKKKYKQWWLWLKAAFLYRKYYPHFWLYVIPRLCIILFPRKVLSFLLMQWIKK